MLSDFSFSKKERSKGSMVKELPFMTIIHLIVNQTSSIKMSRSFNPIVFERDSIFWENNRLESLNKDESGIYNFLDTLKQYRKFKTYYNIVSILASGYIEIDKWNIDIGDIYSVFGYNDAEGIRLRGGARTYFGQNDPWRLEGYMAYGFDDQNLSMGFQLSGLLDRKSRLILSGGNRRDVEQLGLKSYFNERCFRASVASSSRINRRDQ